MPGDWVPGGAIRISVAVPAFNEQGNIGRLIEETYATVPDSVLGEVIVVDDLSEDGTSAEIKALIPNHGTLRYLRHGRRRRPECVNAHWPLRPPGFL